MENTQIAFEEFLLWFLHLEEIPMGARQDFLAHLLEVKTLDEKAVKFIQDSVEYLLRDSRTLSETLQERYEQLSAQLAQEEDPEQSLQSRIVLAAEKGMTQLAQDFKEDYVHYEKKTVAAIEATEQEDDREAISRLKAKFA